MLPAHKGWDVGEYKWIEGYGPAAGPEQFYISNGSENFGHYKNPQLDKLYKQQDVLTQQSQRQPTLQQAETVLHNQLPTLWYYSPQEIDTSIDMMGYTPNPWEYDTWNCYDWDPTNG